MKVLFGLLLCFTFGLTIFAQSKDISLIKKEIKKFKHSNYYSVKYDKFRDNTSISFGATPLGVGSYSTVGTTSILKLVFDFRGQVLSKKINEFTLFVITTANNWQYLDNRKLLVLADEKRLDLGDGDRESDIPQPINQVLTKEKLTFVLSRSEFEEIIKSKNLEMKVGNINFKIRNDTKEGFANILRLSE